MQKILLLLSASMLFTSSVAIGADDDSVTAFMKCARIASDAQRLSCYDRLATELIELGVSGATDDVAERSVGQTPPTAAVPPAPSDSGPAVSPDRSVSAPSPAVASGGGAAAVATNEQGFGLERVENAQGKDIKSIQSRYVGEFTGWEGDTTFTLENGQVWQQIESGRMSWTATNPVITIKRGFMGSYMLSVEGVNKKVRVKRIK
jgi:hypothetical protein